MNVRHNLGLWLKVEARAVGETTPRVANHSSSIGVLGKTRSAKKMPIKLFSKVRGSFNGISGQNNSVQRVW